MFSSIYTGLTGLMGFSKGLDVISHNVANMNTPGFKASQLLFQDLFYQYRMAGENQSALQLGGGVATERSSLQFTAGEMRETGNDADVAIDGNGFFILRKDGETFYTRDGQFEFDTDGFLVARGNKARVAALLNGVALEDINISGLRVNPPVATTEIKFKDEMSINSQSHEINNVTVIDSAGGTHTFKITLTKNTTAGNGNFWDVAASDERNVVVTNPGSEIRFQNNALIPGFNTVSFTYAPPGAAANTIVLNFGTPGDPTAVQLFSGPSTSNTKVSSQNGRALGALTKITFDADGNLVATYSNAQTTKGARVALGWFESLSQLQEVGGNLFVTKEEQPRLANPGQDVMGKLAGKSVELSNVELTQQFTDLIILQRGYQASSQVISATNEMVQQLFDLRKR